MAAKKIPASFWSGPPRENEETLGEAHALALLHGDVHAAPAVHQMIAACMPGSGYAVMAYPCTYAEHYSKTHEQRRWNEGRAKLLDEKLHEFARAAITHREEIEAVHRSCFSQYRKMLSLPQREEAASCFRAKVRERFIETRLTDTTELTYALPATGSGFGDTEQNKKVEDAAVRIVSGRYAKEGWQVTSVEAKRCGFDLLCMRDGIEEHVEAKGVASTERRFVITAGELKQAKNDECFVLALVTNALSGSADLQQWRRDGFLKEFRFEPIQYWATVIAEKVAQT